MLGSPRRMRLADLIGQDTARTALLRAIERGHLAHAYLFDGPPGVGKRGAALRAGDGAQLRDGARARAAARARSAGASTPASTPTSRRSARRAPAVRSSWTTRAGDPGAGALAAARGRGARHRHRRRRRDEPERRQLPAQDAGGAAGAQSPGAVHQRARSPAADDPVAHAARALPAAVGRAAAGAGAPARHPRRARRDRGDAGRRIGGAAVRARRRGRRRRRGADAGGAAGGGRRARRTAPVFDFAAAQASDKPRQGGQGRPRHGSSI